MAERHEQRPMSSREKIGLSLVPVVLGLVGAISVNLVTIAYISGQYSVRMETNSQEIQSLKSDVSTLRGQLAGEDKAIGIINSQYIEMIRRQDEIKTLLDKRR